MFLATANKSKLGGELTGKFRCKMKWVEEKIRKISGIYDYQAKKSQAIGY